MKLAKLMFTILIDSILMLFFKLKNKNKNRIIITSTNNTEFNFNSKYIFEYYIKENKNSEVFFVINNTDKKNKLEIDYPNRIIDTRSIHGKLIALNAKIWLTSTFDLPLLSVVRDNSRINFHMGHGIPLKKIGLSENNISYIKLINRKIRTRQFTHAISYSEKLKPQIEKIFDNSKIHYLNIGQPRNDCLYNPYNSAKEKILSIISDKKTNPQLILYCPTWRPYEKTKIFPFDDFDIYSLNKYLYNNNTYLFVRGHPFFEFDLPHNFEYTSNILPLSSKVIDDITGVLCGFDMLITDYSSIFLDFLSTQKKMAFIPYDIDKYSRIVGFSFDYNYMTPGQKLSSQDELITFIQSDDNFSEEKKSLIKEINLKNNNCLELSELLFTYQNRK
ncbi:CDP-glycerol glycerophosphotransferase family protein [Morganella morganii]|uniref:CDP-glycerol glycerophosphotransferase family protein n=1 Tax=Morganella morganii TaxID=582 RepID=UPI0028D5DFB7|nr:CDP-glycerol glycerophosphotransferase family protein [Morganella morganii]WNP30597.1 CDP-glycerol glycerophosphotransferase family protein [Morganella morganii]